MIDLNQYKGTYPWVDKIIYELEDMRARHAKLVEALIEIEWHANRKAESGETERYGSETMYLLDKTKIWNLAVEALRDEKESEYSGPSKAGERDE